MKAAHLLGLALLLAGCEQAMHDMYDQAKYKPLASAEGFPDGQSARPLPAGATPAAGSLAESSSGRLGQLTLAPETGPMYPVGPGGEPLARLPAEQQPALKQNPFPYTPERLARGRERFDIYCAPCHGELGDGDGMIAQRGFPHPPSYHSERLRQAPDSHFYDVIAQGYGVMYPYADRVTPADRWAIVAYIRALQLSQHAALDQLSADERRQLEALSP
jgi:mono/diheme cytochrome c family protein